MAGSCYVKNIDLTPLPRNSFFVIALDTLFLLSGSKSYISPHLW
jgi:hypothetical protein